MTDQLIVKNLYKIFGPHPDEALMLLEKGLSKDEIFTRTRTTVGVQGADFAIREGEVFVVMGLSGSGKSTLVRMLNRLIEPTRGHIYLDGEEVTAMGMKALIRMRRAKMSMVFQSFARLPQKTVAENAAFGLEVSGRSKQERRASAMRALDTVGLGAQADSYPDELSGGMEAARRTSAGIGHRGANPVDGRGILRPRSLDTHRDAGPAGAAAGAVGPYHRFYFLRDRLDGTITGIDPGAGLTRLSKKAIDDYGLDYDLQLSSGAGMTAALERAVRRNQWIVVTGWGPHWMFGAYDLRYLEDPKGVLGSFERVHAVARLGFYQDQVAAAGFFSRMQLPIKDLQQAMYEAQENSYAEAVARYIKNNEKRVHYWVTGEI